MNERVTREERLQSLGEEIANSVSAGAGLIAAIAGIPLLLAFATQRGSNWTVAGALVFRCDDHMAVSRAYGLSGAAAK